MTKISELGAASTLDGAELVPVVQDSATVQTTTQDIADLAQSGTSVGLLAVKSYNPGTLATYTSTSSTSVDIDATNLAVPFTVPASGKVLVRLTALGGRGAGAGSLFWQVRESTSVVSGDMQITNGAETSCFSASFLITGLTPAASLTYKWGYHRDGSATATTYAGGVAGPAVMEVWAAP